MADLLLIEKALCFLSFSVVVSCHSCPDITDNEISCRFDARDRINHQPKDRVASEANQVFKAVWNVPRNHCKSTFGLDLNLESYGILANAEGTNLNGEAIAIFYNTQIGLYPAFEMTADGNVTKSNAGLPQVMFRSLFCFLTGLFVCCFSFYTQSIL